MLVLYDFTFSRLGMVHHGIEVSMSNERRISESVRWVADTLLEFFQKPRLVPDEELRYLGARMKTAARPVEVEGPVIEDLLSVSAYHAGDLKVFVRPEHIVTREFGPSGNLDILDLRNPGPEDLNLARWVSVESPNYGHTISVKANVRSRGMGEYELEAPWKSYFKETGTLPIFLLDRKSVV